MTLYDVIKTAHMPVALACLPLFWIAMLSKKGGRVHVRSGQTFGIGMTFASLTGMAMAAIVLIDVRNAWPASDPDQALRDKLASSLFLIYLGSITLVPVVHGWRVARTRRNPEVLRTVAYKAFLWMPFLIGLVLLFAAFRIQTGMQILLISMAPIGIGLTILFLRYVRDPKTPPRRWFYAHLAAMLAGGIAAHTAGGVFITSLLDVKLPGALHLVPWLAPTVVGVPAIVMITRHYERKFKDA